MVVLEQPTVLDEQWAVAAIRAVVERFPLASPERQHVAVDIVSCSASSAARILGASEAEAVVQMLDRILTPSGLPTGDEHGTRRRAHAVARALIVSDDGGEPLAPALADRIWNRLAADLREILDTAPTPTGPALECVVELAAELPTKLSEDLANDMTAAQTSAAAADSWRATFDAFRGQLTAVGCDEGAVRALADRLGAQRLKVAEHPEELSALQPALAESIGGKPNFEKLALITAAVADKPLGAIGREFVSSTLETLATADGTQLWKLLGQGTTPLSVQRMVAETTARFESSETSSTDLGYVLPAAVTVGRLAADVVVIGSGAAGSVLADRLARAGRRVLVLERGPLIELDEKLESEVIARYALDEIRRGDSVDVQQGRCVGGTTVVTHGVAVALPDGALRAWNASSSPLDATLVQDTAKRIREELRLPELRDGMPGGQRRAGARSTIVGPGDRRLTALSALHSLLPDAQKAHGVHALQVLTECRVERFETRNGRVVSLRCRLDDRRPLQIFARDVVCAAGAIHSSSLLRRSRISERAGLDIRFNLTALLLAEYENDPGVKRDEVRYFQLEDPGIAGEVRLATSHVGGPGMPGWFEDVVFGRRRERGTWTISSVTIGSSTGGRLIPGDEARQASRFDYTPAADDRTRLVSGLRQVAVDAFRQGARLVKPATRREIDIRPDDLNSIERLIGSFADELVLTSGQPLGGNPWAIQRPTVSSTPRSGRTASRISSSAMPACYRWRRSAIRSWRSWRSPTSPRSASSRRRPRDAHTRTGRSSPAAARSRAARAPSGRRRPGCPGRQASPRPR